MGVIMTLFCLCSRKVSATLPSVFMSRRIQKKSKSKPATKLFTYDRDIICLPKSYANEGLIKIPRKRAIREFLASNKLIGKIQLSSDMTESQIMEEIRSVFYEPMDDDPLFRIIILQPSGGDSKCLNIPVVSSSYKWTASAVAGKNAKVPIYILAENELEV